MNEELRQNYLKERKDRLARELVWEDDGERIPMVWRRLRFESREQGWIFIWDERLAARAASDNVGFRHWHVICVFSNLLGPKCTKKATDRLAMIAQSGHQPCHNIDCEIRLDLLRLDSVC